MKRAARAIDRRFVPPVKGVDLEQSLNYIALADVGPRFVEERYTSARTFYARGRRPALERVARRVVGRRPSPLQAAQRLAAFVASRVRWAGYRTKQTGRRPPTDRGLPEEAILRSGWGWCNEQARLYCALAQTVGLVARLVFATNLAKRYGHVVCEVLLPQGWMAVDESFGFCFLMRGRPVSAARVWRDPKARAHFAPIYRRMCRDLAAELGPKPMRDFRMALGPTPLDGFKDLGYHNHYLH
jgi:transglutaminase-like putative cysteine protease